MKRFLERNNKGRLILNRRTMLRGMLGGAAAAIALPTLEAMLDTQGVAYADGTGLPRRLATWFFGNGARLNRWVPQGEGPNYPLSDELAPLANVKEYINVMSGFDNKAAVITFGHYEGMAILSGHPMLNGNGYPKPGGLTIDQVVATHNAGKTIFPSLELGISKRVDTFAGPLIQYSSHKGTDQPLPPQYNPQAVFNKLFGSFTPGSDPSGPLRVSVLDVVKQDALDIQKEVGSLDKQRLEAHLEGVNNLQKQIGALPPVCTLPSMPSATNVDIGIIEPLAETNDAMSEMMAYAFACDLTRAGSVMFSSAIGTTIFHPIGTVIEHHSLTHSENQELVHQGVLFTMQCYAKLIEKLKAMPEGQGSLLDNTIVICASDCSEGATHYTVDQPFVVAGNAGGVLKTPGVHYRAWGKENTADVLLACLKAVVPEATSIGSGLGISTTPCKAILA